MTDREIIDLIHREVVPAVGCTEPVAVALCAAYAGEALACRPEKISLRLSANILKNAMGVGIPGTGMIGLPIAVALGVLFGKSCDRLEVLHDCTPEKLDEAKRFISEGRIDIKLKDGISEKLYIEAECVAGDRRSLAVVAHSHTHLCHLENSSGVIFDEPGATEGVEEEDSGEGLTLRRVWDFAMNAPIESISFINEARKLNENAAKRSLEGNYGHELGKTLSRPLGRGILGDSMFCHILSATSGACDARMAGADIPVMSNSGSGNQGIAATMPVVVFAEENHNTEEELTRALILSHLTAIYIKQSLGRLSALCGCVVASTGSACGLTYLMGGNYGQVADSVKNMVANLAGMVCDGAKPSCALKLSSGVSTAVLSALLAVQNKTVSSVEGIVEDDVDKTIHNLTRVGSVGMDQTDRMVLDIMTHKS